jgi:hypothetical protein
MESAMKTPERKPEVWRFSEQWPRLAFLALTIATGFGMTLFALRGRAVIEAVGIRSPIASLIAVGCPALIGMAILAFGMALLRHRKRPGRAALDAANESFAWIRLAVFVVPIMVVTQLAAAYLSSSGGGPWSALVLAGLVPLVPMTILAFGLLIFTASRLLGDVDRRPR